MPAYRSYLIGALGHVEGVEIIIAADDVAATKAVALGQEPSAETSGAGRAW